MAVAEAHGRAGDDDAAGFFLAAEISEGMELIKCLVDNTFIVPIHAFIFIEDT